MPIPLNTLSPVRTETSAIAGWSDYPARIGDQNDLTAPAQSLSARLSGLKKTLFSENVDLQIIDILESGGTTSCKCKSYEQDAGVESLLEAPESELPRVRIISLHSERSILPLSITETLMQKILTRYKVDPAFLHILFSFGDSPHLSESGSNNLASIVTSDGSRNITYQIRYIEENNRSADAPWSVRQTGVYHHHSKTREFDLFILIHPLGGSVFEDELLKIFRTGPSSVEARAVCENPYRLHVLPFALYLDNWRWYHRSKSDEFRIMNDEVMTLDLKAADAVSLGFEKVQELRDLKDESLSLGAYCKASQGIISALKEIPNSKFENVWDLSPYSLRLEGFVESLTVLTGRISNTIDLFSYALDLKNQYTAADTNKNVYSLSQKTTHDTTAVKWITYLTLVYLPGSFAASVYGMNLFVFNQTTNRIVIAQDFWIYVVTWIPLTALTFLLYGLVVLMHQPPGESRWDWMRITDWNIKGVCRKIQDFTSTVSHSV